VVEASLDMKGWSMTPLERATARLWLSLPFVRRSRRMGISTRRMLVIYGLVNWWLIAVIEAILGAIQ
jgi:hypothetical protein